MFLLGLIFKNTIVNAVVFTIITMMLIYAFGRIIQSKLKYKYTNKVITYPLGLFSYLTITGLVYLPLIFLKAPWEALVFVEFIKNGVLLVYLFVYRSEWLPELDFSLRRLIHIAIVIITTILSVGMFISLQQFTHLQKVGIESSTLFLPLQNLMGNHSGSITYFSTSTTGVLDIRIVTLEKIQGQYYWFALVGNAQHFGVSLIFEYIIPILFVPVITTTIYGFVSENNRYWYEFLIGFVTIMLSTFILSLIGSGSQLFFTLIFILFIFGLLYDYARQGIANNKNVILVLILSIYFQWITVSSIILISVIGVATILFSVDNRTDISRNIFVFIFTFVIQVFIYSIMLILNSNSESFASAIIYAAIIFFFGVLLIIPAYSIEFNNSRREELVVYESKLFKNRKKIFITGTILIIATVLLIMILPVSIDLSSIESYFSVISKHLYISIPVYIFGVLLPSLFILWFNWKNQRVNLLNVIAYLNIALLNPVTFSFVTYVSGITLNATLVFGPTIILLVFWLIGATLDLIEGRAAR